MRKVILIPGNTDLNRGDQALIWESIRIIQDVYCKEDVSITLVQSGQNEEEIRQQTWQTKALGYEFMVPVLEHPSRHFKKSENPDYGFMTILLWGIQSLIDLFKSSLLLTKVKCLNMVGYSLLNDDKRKSLHKIMEADSIFVKGGGMIHSYGAITDFYSVYYQLYLIMLAIRYHKPVYILPNSIGPLKSKLVRKLVVNILKKCKLVTLRENISYQLIHEDLRIHSYCSPDIGFYLCPSEKNWMDYLRNKGIPVGNKKCVAITMRPYRFSGYAHAHLLYEKYKSSVVNLVTYLAYNAYHITFFAHTLGPSAHEDDRIALREVMDVLPMEVKSSVSYIEDFSLDCKDVEKIYSYYDFIVGTRFHSVIFSLNVGVPSIAIAYGGNKSQGIMKDLGIDEFVVDMDKLAENSLVELFKKLEKQQCDYRNKLSKLKEKMNDSRQSLIALIQRTV